MLRLPVVSSNVKAIGYDPEEKTLEVEFLNGGIYQYGGIQQELYDELLAAKSVGRFIAQTIRPGRKAKKIETQGENNGQ